MARFYWDEDADARVAQALRLRGHDVETTVAVGRKQAPDEDQLAYAAAQQRLFVTHNIVDFPRIHAAWLAAGRHHAGLVILVGYESVGVILRRMEGLLTRFPEEARADQLFFLGAQAPG